MDAAGKTLAEAEYYLRAGDAGQARAACARLADGVHASRAAEILRQLDARPARPARPIELHAGPDLHPALALLTLVVHGILMLLCAYDTVHILANGGRPVLEACLAVLFLLLLLGTHQGRSGAAGVCCSLAVALACAGLGTLATVLLGLSQDLLESLDRSPARVGLALGLLLGGATLLTLGTWRTAGGGSVFAAPRWLWVATIAGALLLGVAVSWQLHRVVAALAGPDAHGLEQLRVATLVREALPLLALAVWLPLALVGVARGRQ